MNDWPKCGDCGRFVNLTETHLVRMVYSGYPPQPDHERFTCHACMFVEPEKEVNEDLRHRTI